MDRNMKSVPLPSVKRLPSYLSFLRTLKAGKRDSVSCTHIADELRLDSTQVRKDLAITGIVGRPRVGYDVKELIDAVEQFLGWHNTSDAFLIGVGSLGEALLKYEGFQNCGLNIVAGFDVDPKRVGTTINGKEIFHTDKLFDLVSRMHVGIAVLAVPASVAKTVANMLVLSGINAIWNFSPAPLEVPDQVIVENVNLSSSLAVFCSRLVSRDKVQQETEQEIF